MNKGGIFVTALRPTYCFQKRTNSKYYFLSLQLHATLPHRRIRNAPKSMLKTLRTSRRRPRISTHLCAALAALLLLVSVSVLYSRLGSSENGKSQVSSFKLGFGLGLPTTLTSQNPKRPHQDPIDASVIENLENEGSDTGTDDRIDEFDSLEEDDKGGIKVSERDLDEEEILREVEEEDESEPEDLDGSRRRNSDYIWDHVLGVARRAFNKQPIDQWKQDYVNVDSALESEDERSKIAFSSDDLPVDEDVRRKLDDIRGIEDVLLLKTRYGDSSSLREGWAPWFESKGDFLRRDRMFRSNVELLNPLSNPLLQDPDGVGSTGLTKGDKLVQKVLWRELLKAPFGGQKSFHNIKRRNPESVKERSLTNVEEDGLKGLMTGKIHAGRIERKGLDVPDGDNTDLNKTVKGVEPLSLSRKGQNIGIDDSSIHYVQKYRVSSYNKTARVPLRPKNGFRENQQPSSNLGKNIVKDISKDVGSSMSALVQPNALKKLSSDARTRVQLEQHKYADGRRWGYFPGLHPHLSFSHFMDQFFRSGKCSMRVFMVWNTPPWTYGVRHQRGLESLLYYNPDACVVVFSETIDLDFFNDFVKDGFKIAVVMPNLDELLKDTPVHVFASVWLDWRKIPLYFIHYSELVRLAALYKYGGVYLDSDVIILKSLYSLEDSIGVEDQLAENFTFNGAVMAFKRHSPFIKECMREFYSTYDDALLRWNGAELLTRVGNRFVSRRNNSDAPMGLKINNAFVFFPINSQNITRYFAEAADESEKAQQDALFRKILNDSITFHFWNSLTSALVPEPDSLVDRLLNLRCLRCTDVL